MSKPLYDAIVANDIKAVRAALAKPGVAERINSAVESDGTTPLIKAVGKKGDVNIVKVLLADPRINVNAATVKGVTPLIRATYYGHLDIVKVLLAAPRIDVNAATEKLVTPLMSASMEGHLGIVKVLLAAPRINVNAADKDGTTALMTASSKGHLDVVQALLADPRIDVNAETKAGITALMAAQFAGRTEVARALSRVPGIKVERVQTMAPSVPWKGMSKSTIDMFDWLLDNTDPEGGGLPAAENWSACPVCLKYVVRSEGCMYMNHNCSIELGDTVFHRELYDMYKSPEGRIFWCSLCSRICLGHRHYSLTPHNVMAELVSLGETNATPFFGRDSHCIAAGGGGIAEKIARIRRLREYALKLEAYIGKKDTREAMKELVEATWDAPLKPYKKLVEEILAKREWNISSKLFHLNVEPATLLGKRRNVEPAAAAAAGAGSDGPARKIRAKRSRRNVEPAAAAGAGAGSAGPAWNIAYPNAGNPKLLPIIHSPGYDSTLMDDVAVAIQFRHKLPTGEVNNHVNEYIGINRLFREVLNLRRTGEERGRCWNFPHCNARMFPAELQYILDHVNDGAMKVTDEDMTEYQRLLDLYTESFGYAPPIVGGRRRKTRKARNQKGGADERFTLGPATLAECVVAGGGRKTGRRRHRGKNSRKRRL